MKELRSALQVDDTSATEPYDLRCMRPALEVRVELDAPNVVGRAYRCLGK